MQIEHLSQKKLEKDLLQIIGKYLDLNSTKVFFFGSRVNGSSNDRSDIDVGLEAKEPISSNILWKIKEEVENFSTLYSIDIVDFKSAAKDFREIAYQKIEPITK